MLITDSIKLRRTLNNISDTIVFINQGDVFDSIVRKLDEEPCDIIYERKSVNFLSNEMKMEMNCDLVAKNDISPLFVIMFNNHALIDFVPFGTAPQLINQSTGSFDSCYSLEDAVKILRGGKGSEQIFNWNGALIFYQPPPHTTVGYYNLKYGLIRIEENIGTDSLTVYERIL
ncbi:MAG: hypothetical protein GC181_01440 [Bacteroidetes bacterium]|nr:hypothetical protein [Bacteroidota bacterium]